MNKNNKDKNYNFLILLAPFGPAMAGFNLALAIGGIYSFGPLAKLFIEFWLKLTRLFWTKIQTILYLPNLDNALKDSLTTLLFFIPMAVTPFILKTIEKDDPEESAKYFIIAFPISITFLIILGYQIIEDLGRFLGEVLSNLHYVSTLFGLLPDILGYISMIATFISIIIVAFIPAGEQKDNALGNLFFRFFIVLIISLWYVDVPIPRLFLMFFTFILLFIATLFSPRKIIAAFGFMMFFIMASYMHDVGGKIYKWLN